MSAITDRPTLLDNVFTENLLAGLTNTVLSSLLALFQGITLKLFATDKALSSNPSYIIMLNLTIADLLQLTFHILSGFFIIFQTTFHFWIVKVSGALINAGCVTYTQMTMLLAINRFVVICCPQRFQFLFTNDTVKVWIFCEWLVGAAFFCSYMSPLVSVLFTPSDYMWGVVGRESVLFGYLEYYSAIFAILITLAAYIAIAFKLVVNRERGIVRTGRRANEMRILSQAVIISAFVTLLQYTWYNYETFAAPTKWVFFLINLLWIITCGINPILYLLLNRVFRSKVYQMFGLQQYSQSTGHRVRPLGVINIEKTFTTSSCPQRHSDGNLIQEPHRKGNVILVRKTNMHTSSTACFQSAPNRI